ncbi:MAG: sulfite exporter TauE/SafE family protein [Hyphomicrobiales bacterium]
MIDLPTSATFAAVMADPRFPAAIGIAVLTGLVRGFSGFGSALIYVPLMSAVYSPQVAAATFVLQDIVCGVLFLSGIWQKAHWRDVLVMAAAAIFAAQFGTLILQYADPVTLRWALSIFVCGVVAILASGWRYHGKPMLAATLMVGLLAGLIGGAVQISGPPIIVYWLGSGLPADILRANFFAYFSLFSAASIVTYALHGLMTAFVLALAAFVTPVTVIGMAAGSYLFRFASEKSYRQIALVIVALSALISLPLLDGILR